MNITATHVAYYHTCHRKPWLFGNGIQMEHTSELVAEGKLIGETSYGDRARKYTELPIDGIKIDFYDPKEKVITILELKLVKKPELDGYYLAFNRTILELKYIKHMEECFKRT